MLPQFTCPKCKSHKLALITYIRCDQDVEIGINNIHYTETHTEYDSTDSPSNYSCFRCTSCEHDLTTEEGEDVSTEEQLITYLHNKK